MMVGRHLPSFAAAIPSRGSTATMDPPESAGPEVTVTDKPIAIQRAWRNSNGHQSTRPIMLAIAGDSASGKTTITKGIVEALGPERITSICVDDYHKFDREERKDKPFTPLHPDCNYIEVMEQHLQLLAMGHPILKPVYNHKDGTLGRPQLVEPREFVIIEGLHPLHTRLARACFDATVYLDPPEEIRFQWKLNRDTGKRGYQEDQVRKEMEKREPESAEFIRPQRASADSLHIHSYADREVTREVEEEIWKELGVDENVPQALGTIDKGVRSEPLAQAQLILLYHLFQARLE